MCQNARCLSQIGLSNVALRTNDFDSDAIAANLLVPKEPIECYFKFSQKWSKDSQSSEPIRKTQRRI